jgi:small subunit ribosomal protein S9
MPTKPTTKTVRKPRAAKVKKEAVSKPAAVHKKPPATHHVAPVHKAEATPVKPAVKSRYIFATGRRKTSVANVRLFSGKGESVVNKKPLEKYFGYIYHQEEIIRPLNLTGLANQYHFISNISGGGTHSQAHALKHGLAIALSKISPEVRKLLKKNGLLTRDDRKKERKKPGLKRARRSPQWAKR